MAIKINHRLVMVTPDNPAYENKPSDWNADLVITGLTANALLLSDGTDLTQDGTNLLFSSNRLQVGSGTTTSAGLVIGHSVSSGYSGMWATGITPTEQNYVFLLNGTANAYFRADSSIDFRIGAEGVGRLRIPVSTAGSGISITAGTATTDVNALSVTQTWNAAGVAFKAKKTVVTPTAYAAGSMLESWEYNTGQGTGVSMLTELTTINAAATTDTAIQIPANAIVLGVSVRVTVVIPTAATFTVTGTTSGTAFQTGASVSTAATTTDAGTKSCPFLNATAQTIRITPNAQPADNTGRVRVTIHYIVITPPTS